MINDFRKVQSAKRKEVLLERLLDPRDETFCKQE